MSNRPFNWVLVTGASKGIGKAIAELLAHKGLGVILVARRADKLEQIAQNISGQGGRACWLAADLTRREDVQHLAQKVEAWGISLNTLILNAGMALVGPVLNMPLDEWRHMFELNVFAPVALLQALFPLLRKPTRIVFINSIAGREAFPEWGAYAASKFALRALADALRAELKDQNVTVSSIFPSSTDTPLHDALGLGWERNKMLRPESVARAVWAVLDSGDEAALNEIVLEHVGGRF